MFILPIVIATMPDGNDRDFMEQLYRQHHRLMLATAWRYTNELTTVEDIVSDSCLSLMKKIPVLQSLECNKLRMYIVSTVRNTAINYTNKRKVIGKYFIGVDEEFLFIIADKQNVEQKVSLKDELDSVWTAISNLPEKERLIMYMKFARDMSDSDIAKQVGLSTSSIAKYISRSREQIKKMIYTE